MSENASSSPAIPSDGAWDATLSLLREGYHFIPNRCRRLGTDIFRTRLTLTDVICMQGPQAAELFYGQAPLTRQQSMPQTVLRLLQDKGSVQQLDGDQHRHRKGLFISILMAPGQVERLANIFREEWLARLASWEAQERVVLIDEVNLILTRAVCRWTGVPVRDDAEMTTELAGMVEHAGHFRPATVAALWRRRRTERWSRELVQQVRSGALPLEPEIPLHRVATFVDMDGKPLTVEEAAVELINILRPVVAVGRFIVFAALQLHEQPEQTADLKDDQQLEAFAEEVRRKSPFFPFVGARVKEEISWHGHLLPKGQWLLLDLYGTTHAPDLFPEPDRFRTDRAISWRDQDYEFIPQGAGQAAVTHRCPGETITVELLKQSVRLLMESMHYTVPPQDLSVEMNRVPALPDSGFVIEEIKARPDH
ncbi:fatty-acid peroxygenase [Pseudorhizobium tarimense]|uniref:Fatty-acid peroxygenase n=1 Tax=Pseudorhizobium tarimense TaxID=1079109 RepID=A0ABV2H7L0_9HYPH|nr:cytochrome P450 [Pseudorhizobium tarimense]MCJ8519631.1 cytochrome P450 [Pseudorhizobium tarimense]